jgi:hypothetical protein
VLMLRINLTLNVPETVCSQQLVSLSTSSLQEAKLKIRRVTQNRHSFCGTHY